MAERVKVPTGPNRSHGTRHNRSHTKGPPIGAQGGTCERGATSPSGGSIMTTMTSAATAFPLVSPLDPAPRWRLLGTAVGTEGSDAAPECGRPSACPAAGRP